VISYIRGDVASGKEETRQDKNKPAVRIIKGSLLKHKLNGIKYIPTISHYYHLYKGYTSNTLFFD
jgi:hypothetical protein